MDTTATTNTAETQQSTKAVEPDFGKGRYSPLMKECWEDLQVVFGLPSAKAEKLARMIASDIGDIMRNQPVEIKLSKANKDGKLTIREASKVKGVTVTRTLSVLRALNYANEAGANGFIWASTKWAPASWLVEYFNEL